MMYKDIFEYIRWCDGYQHMRMHTSSMRWPLQLILHLAHFEKWGIDFVELIQPVI